MHTINAPISLTFRLNKETKSSIMPEKGASDLLLLIEKCISNDRRAQENLYKTYYGLLMSVCLRYKKNIQDAELSLNMGFYKILVNLSKYDTSVPFEYWIRRIMINQCIDEFRKEQRHTALIYKDQITDVDLNYSSVSYNEANEFFSEEYLAQMVRKLPPMAAKVFNLFAIDGLSHKEIVEILDIPEGTSKWYLSEARKKLKEMVIAEFPHLNIG